MRMSERMTSKAPPRASAKPSSPLAADRTVYPAERSIRSMLSRTAVSSSMIRIRGIEECVRSVGWARWRAKCITACADILEMKQKSPE